MVCGGHASLRTLDSCMGSEVDFGADSRMILSIGGWIRDAPTGCISLLLAWRSEVAGVGWEDHRGRTCASEVPSSLLPKALRANGEWASRWGVLGPGK